MIQAIGDKVVAEEMKRTRTEGGLIIPDSAVDPQGYGLVVSVGEEVKNLEAGNIITFHQRGGQSCLINKKLLRILKNDEIYGVLNDQDTLDSLVQLEISLSEEGTTQTKEPSRIIQPVTSL